MPFSHSIHVSEKVGLDREGHPIEKGTEEKRRKEKMNIAEIFRLNSEASKMVH